MAPVPESVRRSSSTSRAESWKTFQPAASSARSRSARVVERMGSTILILNGSRGGLIGRASLRQLLPAPQEGGNLEHVRWDVEAAGQRLALQGAIELGLLVLAPLAPERAVEACGDDRHPHLALHRLVDDRAEDHVCVQICGA